MLTPLAHPPLQIDFRELISGFGVLLRGSVDDWAKMEFKVKKRKISAQRISLTIWSRLRLTEIFLRLSLRCLTLWFYFSSSLCLDRFSQKHYLALSTGLGHRPQRLHRCVRVLLDDATIARTCAFSTAREQFSAQVTASLFE